MTDDIHEDQPMSATLEAQAGTRGSDAPTALTTWYSRVMGWGPVVIALGILLVISSSAPSWTLPAVALVCPSLGWLACHTARGRRDSETEAARWRSIAMARADVVAAVSHEVRTPLTMIKASADLLDEGAPGPLTAQQRVFLTTIQQQCSQVISIAEDLLVQARMDAGQLKLAPEKLDVASLVRDVARAIRPLCDQRQQRITVHTPQRARARADGRLIAQVVTNLLTNASRHTTFGGHVVVRVLDNDAAVAISVTDDGAGMSVKERAHMFDRFTTNGATGGGTGLGLVITKRIIEMHGGRILVDTRLAHGTTVLCTLPKGPPP
jgi:two-component system OmpR family sensor kinase